MKNYLSYNKIHPASNYLSLRGIRRGIPSLDGETYTE